MRILAAKKNRSRQYIDKTILKEQNILEEANKSNQYQHYNTDQTHFILTLNLNKIFTLI